MRGLEQLAKEPARRNGDRRLEGKGVGVGVRQVADNLEGVRRPGRLLHGGERRRDFRVGHLRLSQEPGVAVLGHKEIDLLLRLVADVVEGVVAESEVVPHINGLGEMACDKVLETRPFVRDLAPVALVPLWRLANRVLDVPEPRTHRETFVEVFERRLPRLDGRLGDAYLAGEGCRGDHVAGAGEEEFRKDAYAGDVGDLREVANILPEKLLPAELAPADGEAPVMPYERFGEAAVFPEGVPVGLGDGAWRVGFPDFEFGADKFGDPKGVHVVEEVASHKAVAAALVDVEARAARDNEAHAVLVDVEEALDEVFPSDELVDFVKGEDWPVAGGDVKPRRSREAGGVPGDKPPRCEVVPGEVVVGEGLCESGLPALARPGEKRHLAVVVKVFPENVLVNAFSSGFHDDNYIKCGDFRQNHSSGNARMVNTKLALPLEWYGFSGSQVPILSQRGRGAEGNKNGCVYFENSPHYSRLGGA